MSHPHTPARASENLCVLLLEDNDADAYLARRALLAVPQVGQVVRARSGQEALGLLADKGLTPDIAFVDLQMPAMGGLEFLGGVVDRGLAAIPMVVLTSSSAVNDALRSRVRGALSVITKPEDPADLEQALADAIQTFTGPARPLYPGREAEILAAPSPRPPATAPPASPASAPTFGRRAARASL